MCNFTGKRTAHRLYIFLPSPSGKYFQPPLLPLSERTCQVLCVGPPRVQEIGGAERRAVAAVHLAVQLVKLAAQAGLRPLAGRPVAVGASARVVAVREEEVAQQRGVEEDLGAAGTGLGVTQLKLPEGVLHPIAGLSRLSNFEGMSALVTFQQMTVIKNRLIGSHIALHVSCSSSKGPSCFALKGAAEPVLLRYPPAGRYS